MKLAAREREILCLAAEGLTDKEIAHRLGIKFRSVRSYWDRMMVKLNAVSRLNAYAIWIYQDRP